MYESAQMLLNRVMIGNLGEDPEIRHTPSGLPLMKFSLATDESYLDREGKPQERVLRHIVAAGKLALSPSRIFHSKHDQRGRAQTRPR